MLTAAQKKGRPSIPVASRRKMAAYSLDPAVISHIEALAKSQGLSRSEMVNRLLSFFIPAPRPADADKRRAKKRAEYARTKELRAQRQECPVCSGVRGRHWPACPVDR